MHDRGCRDHLWHYRHRAKCRPGLAWSAALDDGLCSRRERMKLVWRGVIIRATLWILGQRISILNPHQCSGASVRLPPWVSVNTLIGVGGPVMGEGGRPINDRGAVFVKVFEVMKLTTSSDGVKREYSKPLWRSFYGKFLSLTNH